MRVLAPRLIGRRFGNQPRNATIVDPEATAGPAVRRAASSPLRLACGAMLVAASAAFGQIDPNVTTRTSWAVLVGATDAEINTIRSQGFRIIDIDRLGTNNYDAVFVANSGNYFNSAATWYPSVSEASLSQAMSNANTRLIDLQPWESGGNTLFTAVVVGNVGDDAVPGWGWLYNQTSTAAIDSWVSSNTLRSINLQRYTIGGNTRYSGVALSNTGAAAATGWRAWNATITAVGNAITANPGFVTDVELATQGTPVSAPTFNITGVNRSIRGWWWYPALTSSQIIPVASALGARPIDVERYLDTAGNTRYFVVYVDNTNALESRMRSLIGGQTNGNYGFYLKQVGGSVLAELNADFQAEPASTMKIVHGARAIDRCASGLDALDNLVFNNDRCNPDECPNSTDCNGANETLRRVLERMFRDSDNNSTREIAQRVGGNSALNTWMDGLGFSSINNNHTLGCLCGNTPNTITARQMGDFYEAITNGTLFSQSWQDELFGVMINRDDYGLSTLGTLINEESAGLGLTSTELADFRARAFWVFKDGGYGCGNLEWRSKAGLVRLPFKLSNTIITNREFSGVTFVDEGTAPNPSIVYSAWWELFREQVRAALVSWANACDSPAITDQPNFQSVLAGQPASFTVAADGTATLTYQWRRNGVNLSNSSTYSGVTTPTLSISAASDLIEGTFSCVVTNSCGSVTSSGANLTVNPCISPFFTNQPDPVAAVVGDTVIVSASYSGLAPLTARWHRNGSALTSGPGPGGSVLSGVTNNTLFISNAQLGNTGNYTLVLTNQCGSETSNAALVQVRVACVADMDDGSGTGTPDGGVTLDDLLYYLQVFDVGGRRADVDDGSSTGTPDGGVSIEDLLYFLVRYEAGC